MMLSLKKSRYLNSEALAMTDGQEMDTLLRFDTVMILITNRQTDKKHINGLE